MQKSGEIIAEILEDDLQTTDTETTIEPQFCRFAIQACDQKEEQVSRPFILTAHFSGQKVGFKPAP